MLKQIGTSRSFLLLLVSLIIVGAEDICAQNDKESDVDAKNYTLLYHLADYLMSIDPNNSIAYANKAISVVSHTENKNNAAFALEISTKINAIAEADQNSKQNDILQKENNRKTFEVDKNNSFIFGLAGFLVLIVVLFFLIRQNAHLKTKEKISQLENDILRRQINPHFIFNSLNSIQSFFLENNHRKGNKYLTKFGQLIRYIMEKSTEKSVRLIEEVEFMENYLSLEQARLQDQFDYEIIIDEKIDHLSTLISPLLLQPFVENSIWHGIQPLEKKGLIIIRISLDEINNELKCSIQDNGIGVETSRSQKEIQVRKHNSKGVEITIERIKYLNKGKNTPLEIKELKDSLGITTGTIATFNLPHITLE